MYVQRHAPECLVVLNGLEYGSVGLIANNFRTGKLQAPQKGVNLTAQRSRGRLISLTVNLYEAKPYQTALGRRGLWVGTYQITEKVKIDDNIGRCQVGALLCHSRVKTDAICAKRSVYRGM